MNSILKPVRAGLAAAFGIGFAAAATASEPQTTCSRETYQSCLNGVSTSVTNGAGLRTSSQTYADLARARKRDEPGNEQAGHTGGAAFFAAGDGAGGGGLSSWASYTYNGFDSDFSFQGTSLAYDADAHSFLMGADTLFGERYLVGLALGYLNVDADTAFNGGGQGSDGFTIAPYLAVLLNDFFSLDVSGGYSFLDYDQTRISPTDGSDTKASFDADRWFIGANANASIARGNWVFGFKLGVLHSEETQDAYRETGSAASGAAGTLRAIKERDLDLTQLTVGGDLAYLFGGFEPYLAVAYVNDVSRDDGTAAGGLPKAFTVVQPPDDDEVQLAFGIRYFANDDVTATLEYLRVEGRDAFDSDSVLLSVRVALD
jgi:hypothetical protein